MEKLSMTDVNSLNAISGYLRCVGLAGMADTLLCIQRKVTAMLEEANNELSEDSKRN